MNSRNAILKVLVSVVVLVVLYVPQSLAQGSSLLSNVNGTIEIKVGEPTRKVTITDANGSKVDGFTCIWLDSAYASFAAVESDVASSSFALTAIKETTVPLRLRCEKNGFSPVEHSVVVSPSAQDVAVTIAASGEAVPSRLNLLKGQALNLNSPADIVLEKVNDASDALGMQKTEAGYTLNANSVTQAEIRLRVKGGGKINSEDFVSVQIAELVPPKGPQTVVTGADIDLTDLLTLRPELTPTSTLKICSSHSALTVNSLTIRATQSFPNILVDMCAGDSLNPIATIALQAVSAPVNIKIVPLASNTVIVDQRILIASVVEDADGSPVRRAVKWTVVNDSDEQYVTLAEGSNGSVEVLGIKAPSDGHAIELQVALADTNALAKKVSIYVRGSREVVGFQPVDVRIDMLDERTAKDLFGGRAAVEYHIAKIRIVNELDRRLNGGPASSLIFFSDALELRVSLEKKAMKKSKGGFVPITKDDILFINNWKDCSREDLLRIEADTRAVGGSTCADLQSVEINRCRAVFARDKSAEKAAELEGCIAETRIRRTACERRVLGIAGNCGCVEGDIDCLVRCDFWKSSFSLEQTETEDPKDSDRDDLPLYRRYGQVIPFRPYVYQVVANTHDRRADRSWRSRIFLGMNILGAGASFVTAIAVPGIGSDLPLGLDKYQNLLIPTAEKLFPSMREVQRQNIVSLILPPLVEVPYGTDVSKYVFFPKKQIAGILPNHWVRITSISSHYIKVKVGVVQKSNVQIP